MMEIDAWTVVSLVIKIVVYGASLIAAGTGIFHLVFAAEAIALNRLVRCTIAFAAMLGAAATVLQMGAQAGMLAGGGPEGMIDGEMLGLLAETPAGDAYFARLAGLTLLLLSLALPGLLRAILGALGAVTVCVSFSLSGHATEASPYPIEALVTLHLLGIAFWVGVFLPLGAAASGQLSLAQTARLAERFGRLAAWVVGALALAGLFVAWELLGTATALVTTPYGRMLAAKLLLVALLLGLAAMNKLKLTPAMRSGSDAAATSLTKSIKAEAGLVLLILIVTAGLTTTVTLPT